MPQSNAEVVRKAATAFAAGDMETLTPLLAEDVVLHVPGTNQASGDYQGRDSFFNDFVGTLMSLTGGQLRLEIHDVVGSDEHAAGIYTLTATRGEKTFSWRHVNVYHVRNEQLAEIWQHPGDFLAWNEFWT